MFGGKGAGSVSALRVTADRLVASTTTRLSLAVFTVMFTFLFLALSFRTQHSLLGGVATAVFLATNPKLAVYLTSRLLQDLPLQSCSHVVSLFRFRWGTNFSAISCLFWASARPPRFCFSQVPTIATKFGTIARMKCR